MAKAKPNNNVTYHIKTGGFEYWQYRFSSTVLIAEKRLKWYDVERFRDLQADLKKNEKVRFYWHEASETSHSYTKKSTKIELYKKYPEDTDFKDKVDDMKRIIDKYEL